MKSLNQNRFTLIGAIVTEIAAIIILVSTLFGADDIFLPIGIVFLAAGIVFLMKALQNIKKNEG